jgi:UDP-glucose 4-epimerase
VTLAWVVGRGGLLGSHVAAALRVRSRDAAFLPGSFSWNDPGRLFGEIEAAVSAFSSQVRDHDGWSIFWCAGSGIVGASAASLGEESRSFERFLARLRPPRPGRFFLASSAGGVWGGSTDRPITEASPPRPISAYGLLQLEKEGALARWAGQVANASTLVGRLSNLYGPGQALAKAQGLVSSLTRSLLLGRPAHVFVPLDTIRDYLYAEDAAQAILRGMDRLRDEATRSRASVHALKLFASEQSTTIGGLIGALRRTAKQPLRVVTGLHPATSLQPACLQFRSAFWRDEPPQPVTGLLEGMDRVFRHELRLHQAGLRESA